MIEEMVKLEYKNEKSWNQIESLLNLFIKDNNVNVSELSKKIKHKKTQKKTKKQKHKNKYKIGQSEIESIANSTNCIMPMSLQKNNQKYNNIIESNHDDENESQNENNTDMDETETETECRDSDSDTDSCSQGDSESYSDNESNESENIIQSENNEKLNNNNQIATKKGPKKLIYLKNKPKLDVSVAADCEIAKSKNEKHNTLQNMDNNNNSNNDNINNNNENENEKVLEYECQICHKKYETKKKMQMHNSNTHIHKFQCNYCDKIF